MKIPPKCPECGSTPLALREVYTGVDETVLDKDGEPTGEMIKSERLSVDAMEVFCFRGKECCWEMNYDPEEEEDADDEDEDGDNKDEAE